MTSTILSAIINTFKWPPNLIFNAQHLNNLVFLKAFFPEMFKKQISSKVKHYKNQRLYDRYGAINILMARQPN